MSVAGTLAVSAAHRSTMRRKKRAGVMVGTELAEKQAVDTREQILVGQKKTNESWFLGSHFLLWRNEWGREDKIHHSLQ